MLPSISLSHVDERSFPDAGAFRPERFLGPDAPGGYAWIPFGGGARRCIGAPFALLEMREVLRTVLTRCELRASDLSGSAGMFRLKEELTRRVNAAIQPAQVNAVLFKEIIVQ